MISSNYIPEKISEYNAYLDGSKMIGVAASVTLPEINMKTSTVSGVGVNGELDSPTIGQFESMEQEIQFNTLYSSATKMLHPGTSAQITLRAAMQNENKNGGYSYKGLRIVLGGKPKELDPGKLKRASTMDSSTTLEVTRYLVEIDGVTVIDIDKYAGRYYVDGEDILAEVNALI